MVNRTKSHALAYLFLIAIGVPALLSADIYADTNQLIAIPNHITINSDDYPGGGPAGLSFVVLDSLGDPVSFWVWNATEWLQPDTMLNSPLITPDSVNYLAFFDMLEQGTYEDTIRIQADGDVGMARVIVTLIQGGHPSQAYVNTMPRFFDLDLLPGESVEDISLFVYENRGYELPYHAELINNSSWLQFQGGSASGTTPDTIFFRIDTEGLDTGLYVDSILIYNPLDNGSPYFELKVPVTIFVGYIIPDIITAPRYYRFMARQGDIIEDSLIVMESHNMAVPFMGRIVPEESFIELNPAFAVIQETPGIIYFTINTGEIEPGFYSDSIEIYDPFDSVWTGSVYVPVALDLVADQAYIGTHPSYFGIELYQNESRNCLLLVYDRLHEAYPFTTSFMFASPWLVFVGGPQVYTTPDSVEFTVTASLSPGIYVDTLIITSADEPQSFEPVKRPVVMTINESPGDIVIRVFPEEIDKTVIIGHEDLAGFVVYEAFNRQIEFQLSNNEAWLTVIDSGNAEYLTPHFVRYGLNAANLDVGQYNDTVHIDDVFEQARWGTVKVPVRLNVVEAIPPELIANPSSLDFYLTPADSSFYFAVNIEEVHGDTLEFWPTGLEESDWISILYTDTAFVAPGWLLLFISPANLECQDYQDTIEIYLHNPVEENPIPDLIITVTMHITNGGFPCGDFNYDGQLNLLDILAMIEQLYINSAGQNLIQGQAIDFSQGSPNLLHILYLIDHLYGDPPGPPPACG